MSVGIKYNKPEWTGNITSPRYLLAPGYSLMF